MKTTKLIPIVSPGNYDHDFIVQNPIPARCSKCGYMWIDGIEIEWIDYNQWINGKNTPIRRRGIANDAIRSASLENCRCFYCQGNLEPIDAEAYQARLLDLPNRLCEKQLPILTEIPKR